MEFTSTLPKEFSNWIQFRLHLIYIMNGEDNYNQRNEYQYSHDCIYHLYQREHIDRMALKEYTEFNISLDKLDLQHQKNLIRHSNLRTMNEPQGTDVLDKLINMCHFVLNMK